MTLLNRLAPLFLTAAALAQQPVPPTPAPGAPITLSVTVEDKAGHPVPGLAQSDFTLFDNKRPQPITAFRGTPQEPTHVFIVVDSVNITQVGLGNERDQIDKFLVANGKLPFPTALAILRDKGISLQQGFSTDGAGLAAFLEKTDIGLRDITRSSGFYGANDRLGISLDALRALITSQATLPGRKIILWVSPGWPILSGPGVDLTGKDQQSILNDVVNFYQLFRTSHTTLYAIDPLGSAEGLEQRDYYEGYLDGINEPRKTAMGDISLQVLAAHSGGLVLNSNNDITQLLGRAFADTAATYQLTFTPAPPEASRQYHHLELRLTQPNLKPHTLDGYYTTP